MITNSCSLQILWDWSNLLNSLANTSEACNQNWRWPARHWNVWYVNARYDDSQYSDILAYWPSYFTSPISVRKEVSLIRYNNERAIISLNLLRLFISFTKVSKHASWHLTMLFIIHVCPDYVSLASLRKYQARLTYSWSFRYIFNFHRVRGSSTAIAFQAAIKCLAPIPPAPPCSLKMHR